MSSKNSTEWRRQSYTWSYRVLLVSKDSIHADSQRDMRPIPDQRRLEWCFQDCTWRRLKPEWRWHVLGTETGLSQGWKWWWWKQSENNKSETKSRATLRRMTCFPCWKECQQNICAHNSTSGLCRRIQKTTCTSNTTHSSCFGVWRVLMVSLSRHLVSNSQLLLYKRWLVVGQLPAWILVVTMDWVALEPLVLIPLVWWTMADPGHFLLVLPCTCVAGCSQMETGHNRELVATWIRTLRGLVDSVLWLIRTMDDMAQCYLVLFRCTSAHRLNRGRTWADLNTHTGSREQMSGTVTLHPVATRVLWSSASLSCCIPLHDTNRSW